MRKATVGIVMVLAGLAVFAWTQRPKQPIATEDSVARAANAPAVEAPADSESRPRRAAAPVASATNRRAPLPANPLPSEGMPLAEIHDALAARARAGDNAAAMRLVFDLTRCTSRAGADAETLAELDAGEPSIEDPILARLDAASRRKFEEQLAKRAEFCRGVAGDKVEKRGEWLLLAAERGDAEAMACYAAAPNDFAPPLLGDAWFDWSRRWRERAPAFAEMAYAQGRVDILPILAEAYSGQTLAGVPISTHPLAAVLRSDPVRATAYSDIASRIGFGSPQATAEAYAALDDAERAHARALADRDAGKFTTPADGRVAFLPCRRLSALRRAGSP
jgi:hypothetical protein